jgi:hypothetical protein
LNVFIGQRWGWAMTTLCQELKNKPPEKWPNSDQ